MKRDIFKLLSMGIASGILLTGCGASNGGASSDAVFSTTQPDKGFTDEAENQAENDVIQSATELEVRFGDGGEPYILYLYDNDTAAAIARHVGSSDWRLPIYHYDDYDNWEVMQYYDIPSRYEIPSAPEPITEEKAGTVYYSEPNRIILYYQDAEVSAEYTPVGYFEYTEEFLKAVQDNPVLEGWGNKIVQISDGE